ncbi:MAG: RICIN domain-containing protein, partial [Bacteroidia bacterium]
KKAYIISSKTNNWVMDISGGAANVGANIITYPKNKPSGTANQKFRLVPAGGDYVYIESIIGERMVIDVSDYKRHDGANVALVRRGGGTNAQKWKISTYRDGSSEVVSAMGGNYYLGVSDDNRNIVLRVGKKGDKTRFNFKELFENYPANNTTVIKSKSDLDVAGEWIEKNGLVAVNWTGQAGIDAVNWTTTAAKDIANGFDVLFNGEKVPPPRRGATKSNVPSGVRHYVITVFHVGNYSSGGDGSDFEIFGSVSAIPSGHMYTNKGSNPYLFNKRAGDYVVLKTGKHHSVTHRKDFYVRESDAANAYVSIVTALAEHDDFDNDSFSKTDKLNLANLPVGHYKEHEFLVRTYDGENEIVRLYIAVSRVK